jgi:glycosyltransferase involved in cell wall biosynthesis
VLKASIIIPAYNASLFINETLNSILEQTYTNFECIVVNDGSQDTTLEIIRSYTDHRIRLIDLPNSGGPATPRNAGLASAKGEYIFMFDADDLMYPTKLEESIQAFENHPDADILFTNYVGIDASGQIVDPNRMADYQSFLVLVLEQLIDAKVAFINSEIFYDALLRMNFIGSSSVALRRSALGSSDVFNEELQNSDDRLFWTLFARHHHALYLNSILHQYRIQDDSISSRDFTSRGPSKIKALEIIFENCNTPKGKKIVLSQIASDYATLAYGYRLRKDFENQIKFSVQGLKLNMSVFGLKVFLSGCLLYAANKFSGSTH